MSADLIVYGFVVHLFVDWLLQNEWMAVNKMWLSRSWAGWVHGLLHLFGAALVFPYWWAVVIGILHIVIDTRVPLIWWRRVYRQTTNPNNPFSIHVAIWGDQTCHIVVIALVAWLSTL